MTDSTEMQELRAWLTWATTETHVPAEMRARRVPDDAFIGYAADTLRAHCEGEGLDCYTADIAWCLDHHPIAFRDLVLAWATAAEAMRAAVPEHVPVRRPPAIDAPRPEFVKAPDLWEARLVYEYDEPCAGCGGERCTGTSVHCNANRYLAQNPDRFAAL